MATAYYWKQRPNFGDAIAPYLLARFSRIRATWSPVADADILSIGSILDQAPKTFSGFVLGSGKLHEKTVVDLPKAKILALRGPLTAKGVKGDFALGDPGLLASELVPLPTKTYN